ncbi:MAG: hypothetical protein MI923_13455 [Phycisphaerales bacterium]|nr:hypothetical protein [Phycisphaerales bacterium]
MTLDSAIKPAKARLASPRTSEIPNTGCGLPTEAPFPRIRPGSSVKHHIDSESGQFKCQSIKTQYEHANSISNGCDFIQDPRE